MKFQVDSIVCSGLQSPRSFQAEWIDTRSVLGLAACSLSGKFERPRSLLFQRPLFFSRLEQGAPDQLQLQATDLEIAD